MSEPLVCLTTHSFIVEIGCYSLIMISSSSVISLIKKVNLQKQINEAEKTYSYQSIDVLMPKVAHVESEPSEEEVREQMNKILAQDAAHASWDRELEELNTELPKVESAMVILKTTLITRFSISHIQVFGRTISPAFIVRKCECGRCSLRYFPHQHTGVWCRCRFIGGGRWAAGGERHNQWEGDYHIPILHQSSNISFRTPRDTTKTSKSSSESQQSHSSLIIVQILSNISIHMPSSYTMWSMLRKTKITVIGLTRGEDNEIRHDFK